MCLCIHNWLITWLRTFHYFWRRSILSHINFIFSILWDVYFFMMIQYLSLLFNYSKFFSEPLWKFRISWKMLKNVMNMTAFMLCKIETCLFEKNKETNSLIFALKKRHALNLSILLIFYSGRFDEYHYFLEILKSRFS